MKCINRCLLAMAVAGLGVPSAAHAQNGRCHDPWITQAYSDLYHRAPENPGPQGTAGECNTVLYGGGHWTTYLDLEQKIIKVRGRATAVQAPATQQAAGAKTPAPMVIQSSAFSAPKGVQLARYHIDGAGNLVNSVTGAIWARAGTFYQNAAGQIVAQGGGNFVAQGGGNIVAQGGGNFGPN
ncbi:MAG: hypothetical protein V4555_08585 [Acidobacteriota bacterium]